MSVKHLDRFQVLQTIGTGRYSKVKAVRCPETSEIYAAKIYFNDFPTDIVLREARIMENLRGSAVVRVIHVNYTGTYRQSDDNQKRCAYLLMELCTNGDLYDLTQTQGGLSLSLTKTIFIQILSAVSECHSQQVFHRDLKPENILFTSDFHVKLADFGSAQFSGETPELLYPGKFTAPESTRSGYRGEFSRQGDVFALGCILFYLVTQTPPFYLVDVTDLLYRSFVESPAKFWKCLSQRMKNKDQVFTSQFKELIEAMINPDPRLRPSIEEVRSHPWFEHPVVDLEALRNEIQRKRTEALALLQNKKESRRKIINARDYRGTGGADEESESFSLSLNEINCKKMQDEHFFNKFTQVKSWLSTKRLIQEVHSFLSVLSGCYIETVKDAQLKITIVDESDSFDFKVTVYEMAKCNLVYFKPLRGRVYDLIEIVQQFVDRLSNLSE